jgi:20S proteasome alpha/beta subunit
MIPRPQERKRQVTLIAGLVSKDGIVIAADSEESRGGGRKSTVSKIGQAGISIVAAMMGGKGTWKVGRRLRFYSCKWQARA